MTSVEESRLRPMKNVGFVLQPFNDIPSLRHIGFVATPNFLAITDIRSDEPDMVLREGEPERFIEALQETMAMTKFLGNAVAIENEADEALRDAVAEQRAFDHVAQILSRYQDDQDIEITKNPDWKVETTEDDFDEDDLDYQEADIEDLLEKMQEDQEDQENQNIQATLVELAARINDSEGWVTYLAFKKDPKHHEGYRVTAQGGTQWHLRDSQAWIGTGMIPVTTDHLKAVVFAHAEDAAMSCRLLNEIENLGPEGAKDFIVEHIVT